VGVHARSLDAASAAVGQRGAVRDRRRPSFHDRYPIDELCRPERFGAAVRSAAPTTGVEVLLILRFEPVGVNRGVKGGAGRGLDQRIGALVLRLVITSELFNRSPSPVPPWVPSC
jgi:hypothetical protein